MSRVAVITRTKDRPIFLQRALKSVSEQTYSDFTWAVVNDGGKQEYVDTVVAQARSLGINTLAIHCEVSSVMEAAANDGIRHSESEYLVIHDDDDTWDPNFLETTVAFMDTHRDYVGVICHTTHIVEQIRGEKVKTVKKKLLNPELLHLHITELHYRNLFPPISLLYRRKVIEQIGLYDETLPVLGDWDFNLRLILAGDIGVIRQPLAFYHTRPQTLRGPLANSIHSHVDLLKQYDAVIRNRAIRQAIRAGILHPGHIMLTTSAARSKRGIAKTAIWKFL